MKKIILCLFTFIILISYNIYSKKKILKVDENEFSEKYIEKITYLDKNAKPGKQYLFLIAIDTYKTRLPLNNYISDANDLKRVLYEQYYINEIKELYDYDATNTNIISYFKKLRNVLKPDDSIIIYYGGHGYLDENSNEAWWVPSDAGINEKLKERWISIKEIESYLTDLPANHVLLLNDSCFSTNYLLTNEISTKEINDEFIKISFSQKSKQVISSGIKETGYGRSSFFNKLINFLKSNSRPYLTVQTIYNSIKNNTTEKPIFGYFKDSALKESGNFIFFLRQNDPAIYKEDKTLIVEKIDENKSKDESTDLTTIDELKKKEAELKKKEEELLLKENNMKLNTGKYNNVNIAGVVLCTLGATIASVGLPMFIVDVTYLFIKLRNEINNSTYYDSYESSYNEAIGFFVGGLGLSIIGLTLVGVSIPMMLFKKKDKKVSLNIDINNNMSIYIKYIF